MSKFNSEEQNNLKENLILKIKAANAKFYKESPCVNCGPGNGCDDCRGCEDAKINHKLEIERDAVYKEYEEKMGRSYDEDLMIQQISDKEKEVEHWRDHCRKCGGNFGDDCHDCSDWEKTFEVSKSLNYLKEEYKRKYNKDFDQSNEDNKTKATNMKNTEIISATKAHELTKESIENDDKCLIPIMNKIKEAIKKKQYSCYIDGSTPKYVIDKLHTLGYKTKYTKGDFRDPRETDIYEVTW